MNEQGQWVSDQQKLKDLAIEFYAKLFTVAPSCRQAFLRGAFPPISEAKFNLLQDHCNEEEVIKAIKEMSPYRSPGPDGFHAGFFQRTWSTTGQAAMSMVQQIMAGDALPTRLAEVLLMLIPKIEHPTALSQFRPISLCNVTYKIFTKLITNRLKDVLGI